MLIKVGYLVPVVIVKALPDYNSYLTLIVGSELMALLPKRFANRVYRVGDRTLASVYGILEGGRIVLSQRSSQYFRKLVELLLSELILDGRVEVKRAATVKGARFAKVSVSGRDGDPVGLCIPYLRDLRQYTDDTVTLVRYSPNLQEYVVNSLVPAPIEMVRRVICFETLREALVRVEAAYLGKFLGRGGLNVALASKLVRMKIKVEASF